MFYKLLDEREMIEENLFRKSLSKQERELSEVCIANTICKVY